MTADSAQRLIDLAGESGIPPATVISAAQLVQAVDLEAGDRGALHRAVTATHVLDRTALVHVLALAVAIATRKPAPPDSTYAITASGVCPACGVTVTVTPGGIPNHPDARIGDPKQLRCICGANVPALVVAVLLEPWEAHESDPDGDVDDEARDG